MTAAAYEQFRTEGYALAGDPNDLPRRVRLYQRVYRDSGKRNVFALIAAHGTLWATGYFKLGMLGAQIASLPYLCIPGERAKKLAAAASFADKIRSINRQVCAESYAIYHYTKHHGGDAFIRAVIGDRFSDLLEECHASNRDNAAYPRHKREELFQAFIDWEQNHVVAPAVDEAYGSVEWPLIARLAKRPSVRFAYFKKNERLRFKDFARKEERLAAGVQACRLAEDLGLDAVEDALGLSVPAKPARAGGVTVSRYNPCAVLFRRQQQSSPV